MIQSTLFALYFPGHNLTAFHVHAATRLSFCTEAGWAAPLSGFPLFLFDVMRRAETGDGQADVCYENQALKMDKLKGQKQKAICTNNQVFHRGG